MVDYEYSDLFFKDSVSKKIIISFDNAILTNEDLYNQEMTLEESLCSESELRFGSCEAGILKFKISDIFTPMIGKWLDVKMVINENSDMPFVIGKYKVNSDNLSADRKYREITAYDAVYDVINSSVITWYNTILPEKDSKVTMRQFRDSLMNYFGLQQKEVTLVNDDMIVEKTIQVGEDVNIDNDTEQVSILRDSSLSGLDVITAICEINGCFGHIGRDGKFHYIYLPQAIQGLYPSKDLFPDHAPDYLPYQQRTGHLYPQSPKSMWIDRSKYIECNYENFITESIDGLQIRQEENDIGQVWPEGDKKQEENCYVIENNFLIYGKSAEELRIIAKNLYGKICNISYRPFEADVMGNPCFEVGDPVRFLTNNKVIVESYILKRTIKGIQALRDSLSADGVEKYKEKVNGVNSSILQLKGKTNTLVRTVEETRLEMRDMGEELSTEISVTAAGINETIKNTKEGLETKISKTVKSIEMSVSNDKTGKKAEVKLLITDEGGTQYEVTADKIDLTGLVSFTNLESGGQTIINGNNITTGEINCSLLNGGEINGQKIVGGKIEGATIKAKEGLYLQYTNDNFRPPVSGEYVFAETGYGYEENLGGVSNDSFLVINTPGGTPIIVAGVMTVSDYIQSASPPQVGDGVFFPGFSYLSRARIDDLQQTFYFENSFVAEDLGEGGTQNTTHEAYLKIRIFGVFVCICGSYNFREHKAKKYIDIDVSFEGLEERYIPKWGNVEVCTSYRGNPFVFVLRTNGKLRITNAGENDVIATGEEDISMGFRFDFLKT